MPFTTPHQMTGMCFQRIAKTKEFSAAMGLAPHGEDVTVDTTHTCGSTLIGLDGTGMVMTFYLKAQARPSPISISPHFLLRLLPAFWHLNGEGSSSQRMEFL